MARVWQDYSKYVAGGVVRRVAREGQGACQCSKCVARVWLGVWQGIWQKVWQEYTKIMAGAWQRAWQDYIARSWQEV